MAGLPFRPTAHRPPRAGIPPSLARRAGLPAILGLGAALVLGGGAVAAEAEIAPRDIFVPGTISPEAQRHLERFAAERVYAVRYPEPGDRAGWARFRAEMEARALPASRAALATSGVSALRGEIGGVAVVELRPPGWVDDGRVIVYAHGGAFVMISAESSFVSSAPMAAASGLRVVSVDYATAPGARWDEIQAEVLAVIRGLVEAGHPLGKIALYGESAGAGLVMSAALALRDEDGALPAAVVLWSPWVDLTAAGDTMTTLAAADPFLTYPGALEHAARAYAGALALDDPRVSPLYADLGAGFPPALVVDSTKSIFLSASVRLYQQLRGAGQEVELDLYEGLPHIFQIFGLPESAVSIERSAAFIERRLQ